MLYKVQTESGDLYRVRSPGPGLDDLRQVVAAVVEGNLVALKWKDEEGDLVTIASDADLTDMLDECPDGKTVCIYTVTSAPASASAAATGQHGHGKQGKQDKHGKHGKQGKHGGHKGRKKLKGKKGRNKKHDRCAFDISQISDAERAGLGRMGPKDLLAFCHSTQCPPKRMMKMGIITKPMFKAVLQHRRAQGARLRRDIMQAALHGVADSGTSVTTDGSIPGIPSTSSSSSSSSSSS